MPSDAGRYYCPQCGYDLRGQTVTRCPECGFLYDTAALDSMAREAFHECIGRYLNAVSPLVWCLSVLLGRALAMVGLVFPCSLVLLVLLPPAAVNGIQNWMMPRTADDWRPGRRRPGSWWPEIEQIAFPIAVASALVISGTAWLLFSRHVIGVISTGLLAWGGWSAANGALCHRDLERASQHLAMAPRRVRTLRRARIACWALAGLDVLLWLVLVVF